MELEHSFVVPVDADTAWQVLLDVERIAPCMPGASIDEVNGDDFTGSVKVRLGPIGLTYKGKASFVEKDADARRAVIRAQGKDARGNGTATATVTATLTPDGDSTQVAVLTDLNITGKPAQFGRGVMVDVGNKLIGQFADCLAGKLAAGAGPGDVDRPAEVAPDEGAADLPAPPEASEPTTSSSAPATPPRPAAAHASTARRAAEPEPIDLLGSAGPAVAKRLLPVAIPLAVVVLIWLWRRRS